MDKEYINLLIEKFWGGIASKEEIFELYSFLKNEDELIKDEMRSSLKIDLGENLLPQERGEEILKIINLEIVKKGKGKSLAPRYEMYKKITGWVAILLIIITSTVFFRRSDNEKNSKNSNAVAVLSKDTIFNRSDKMRIVTLSDKSTVLLYPMSSISFDHNFKKRNIILIGKASFNVVHDKNNIFSVTTGEIVTTDIGTEFEINAFKNDKIIIHLIRGEIKVGKVNGSKLEIKNQYLKNGETLKIDANLGKVVLIKPSLLIPPNADNRKQLVFNKTPVDIVFKDIALRYNTKINFKNEDVSKLTFTGKIEPNDSILNILNIICYVNNLHFTSEPNGYTIIRN